MDRSGSRRGSKEHVENVILPSGTRQKDTRSPLQMSSFAHIKSDRYTHIYTHTHASYLCMQVGGTAGDLSFHGASKHGAMFADVRQHFILSSDPKEKKARKISPVDWLPRTRTHIYAGPTCNRRTKTRVWVRVWTRVRVGWGIEGKPSRFSLSGGRRRDGNSERGSKY